MAQAAPSDTIYLSTDPASGADVVLSGSYTVPSGYCSIEWNLVGGGGGRDGDGVLGDPGGDLTATTPVEAGDVYAVVAGGLGGNADAVAGTPGAGGTGATGYAGKAGTGTGGGGGGASTVVGGPDSLVAFGGMGAGPDGGLGGGGTTNTVTWPGAVTGSDGQATAGGYAGRVTGYVKPCAPTPLAPKAPTGLSATAGSGSITVTFTPTPSHDENGTDADSWQYSLNGGAWTTVTTTDAWGDRTFTLTGLTNGTTYSIKVRGVSDTAGAGAAGAAVSATPAVPIGVPSNVVAKAGASSVKVTWDAPTSAGTFPVGRYQVSWGGGEMGGLACKNVPVDKRVCVFPARPGLTYSVRVWAVDTKGNHGVWTDVITAGKAAAPTVPTTAPTGDAELDVPAAQSGPVSAGKEITLRGSGYLPNSTVTVVIYSEPQVLTTVVTDATGSFEVTVTVPEGLASGEHTLVASGVDPDGNARYLTLPVTVTGGTTGAGGLAYTGFDIAAPLTGGLVALLLGAGLIVVSRRRATA